MGAERPGCAAASMATRVMRSQGYSAEDYGISIVENSVDTGWWIGFDPVSSKGKVLPSTATHNISISIHNQVHRMGLLEHFCCPSHMVKVRLSIEENLCIFPCKSKLFDACADQMRRAFKVRIDQNVSCRSCNEVGRQVATPNIIKVVGNLEWGQRSCP